MRGFKSENKLQVKELLDKSQSENLFLFSSVLINQIPIECNGYLLYIDNSNRNNIISLAETSPKTIRKTIININEVVLLSQHLYLFFILIV
jgi:hypothetical protein